MGLQQLPHLIDIARFHGGPEQLGRRFGQRLNSLLHVCGPVAKAVCARNHKLRRAGQNLGFLFRVAGYLSVDGRALIVPPKITRARSIGI